MQAEAWAAAGTRVPLALAESDAVWREALDDAGVDLAADLPASDADEDEAALIARTYLHPDGHTMTLLMKATPFAHHWDALLASQEEWELTDTFATGIRAPGTPGTVNFPSPSG